MTEEVEWQDRTQFQQLAETLGVPTDLIATARITNDKEAFVLYTPYYPDNETVYGVELKRDNDGVWQKKGLPLPLPKVTGVLRDMMGGPDG
jgi:hypothetical protein